MFKKQTLVKLFLNVTYFYRIEGSSTKHYDLRRFCMQTSRWHHYDYGSSG